jgi:hypothetical protein
LRYAVPSRGSDFLPIFIAVNQLLHRGHLLPLSFTVGNAGIQMLTALFIGFVTMMTAVKPESERPALFFAGDWVYNFCTAYI